jgi:glutaredoxin|tara:strand:+ start:1993 stop:2778 length:786 start_codon:yes stop_codon:yes gene_type:complete
MGKEMLTVYWQPGCSSCLNLKEHLTRNHVPFHSVNVRENADGFKALGKLGVRQVPVLVKGDQWCDGQMIAQVNILAGIAANSTDQKLAPKELADRMMGYLPILKAYVLQIPSQRFDELLPGRPRSYGNLACHCAEIIDLFIKVSQKKHQLVFDDYEHPLPNACSTPEKLSQYVSQVAIKLSDWVLNDLPHQNFAANPNVYYGQPTLHEYMERTAWHAGQHLRQLELVIKDKLAQQPEPRLSDNLFMGLPMPHLVWDDQLSL